MMTVLQSQHVSKRASSSSLVKRRSGDAHWDTFGLPSATLHAATLHAQRPSLIKPSGLKGPLILRPRQSEHSYLLGQLVKAKKRRVAVAPRRNILERFQAQRWEPRSTRRELRILREQEIRREHAPRREQAARAPGPAAQAVLRVIASPWLIIGCASAAAVVFLVSSLGLANVAFPPAHPSLPSPSDVDQSLYSLVIPEPAVPRAATVNPVLLATLKVTEYRAQAGDTIGRIAARYKLNVDTVVSWNDIRDARSIPVGTTLSIPNSNGLRYVVRRGDTLQGISRSWGVDFNSVLDWNNLKSSTITPGQEIFLPGIRMSPDDLSRIMGSLFIYPVIGRISSYFGDRADPFTGVPNFHNGIDIVNPPGAPIQAAAPGTVADVGFNNNYGNYVILRHTGGYQTLYGHMTRYTVSRGQKIGQGQKIGEVGTTGYSTGPHVHFSIFRNGQPVDPLRFLK